MAGMWLVTWQECGMADTHIILAFQTHVDTDAQAIRAPRNVTKNTLLLKILSFFYSRLWFFFFFFKFKWAGWALLFVMLSVSLESKYGILGEESSPCKHKRHLHSIVQLDSYLAGVRCACCKHFRDCLWIKTFSCFTKVTPTDVSHVTLNLDENEQQVW